MRAAFALVFLAAAAVPKAAPSLEFSSTFESIKVHARPGEVVTRSFQLHLAPGQEKARFRSLVEDWWQSADGTQSFYRPPGTLAHSCSKWIRLEPLEAEIAAGGDLRVQVTAAIPADTRPGGYWCVLTVNQLPDPLSDDAGVDVRFLSSISTGIFIYLDPVERDVRIAGVELARKQARITLRNLGNAPVAVESRIELFRPDQSQPQLTAAFPRTTLLTEPIASRLITTDLPDLGSLPPGHYKLQVVVDLGLDHDIGVQRDLEIPRDLQSLLPPR
jgi:hypothetical protein